MTPQLYDLLRRFGKPATLVTVSRTYDSTTGVASGSLQTWYGVVGHIPYQALGQAPSQVPQADAWFITDQVVTEDTEIHCNGTMHRVVRLHRFGKYTIISAKGVAPQTHYREIRHDFTPAHTVQSSVS